MNPSNLRCATVLFSVLAASTPSGGALAGEYELVIEQKPMNVTGREKLVPQINSSVPGTVLRWREGEDRRAPNRQIELHLTGNMQRFIWGFDGKKFSEADPIRLRYGERVRFVFVNDTMTNHPLHLHGMWSELDNGAGAYKPRKHVINIKPTERLSLAVTADALGEWAFHCHLLYHMEAGMFRRVIVTQDAAASG